MLATRRAASPRVLTELRERLDRYLRAYEELMRAHPVLSHIDGVVSLERDTYEGFLREDTLVEFMSGETSGEWLAGMTRSFAEDTIREILRDGGSLDDMYVRQLILTWQFADDLAQIK